ncbi:amino acid adenylation domain-containing protein [Micromonospora sp. NPDC018662]|uniref:amino acid adenylation domain-containing protein n=1 Tax=Micromonospora sp. NPDC018662 TaxID=3364238 RepID=UPI0037B7D279
MRPESTPERAPLRPLPDEGLHRTVSRIAAARPHARAVVAGDRVLTYGDLDRLADGWAARLSGRGLGPGDLVPVLLPRGADLVAALLAVLKTGAAYALLDPTWPGGRIADVVGQLGARLVVAGPGAAGVDGVPVWTPSSAPDPAPDGFRAAEVGGDAACCVFFTSGTTGRPKGVVSPHRATARLFRPGTFARFTPGTTVPLAAPTPWDAFSLELWSALLNGGTSVVVDEPYLSAHSLRDGVSRHGVDTVWLTASLFTMLVDEDLDAFVGLRQVMTGGERMSPTHALRFLRRHPTVPLLNGYGPVETTVFATTHRVTEADCARPGGVPLGRPVPGTEVLVLDGIRPCGPGEVGEICVAGDGVAVGYLGDPEQTASRFPVVTLDGRPRRLYRTGDLGRWAPDGPLEFRGRADRQVKIHGHRVEPVEVERQIETSLGVRRCRVVARPDADGRPAELVAFCVPSVDGDALPTATDDLAAVLLPHHRPAAVVSVDAFPLTSQGKVDEAALLARVPAGPGRPTGAAAATGPDDPTVRLVADVFAALLGRATVPADVSFFDLGGESLLGGRACARLGARLGRPVPVSALYRHPTAAGLAGWLRAAVAAPGDSEVGGDAAGGLPLTAMQLVFLTRHLVDPADRTGHCLLVWRVDGPLDRAALEAAVAQVHRRHEPLRAAYRPDPRPAAWVTDIAPPALEVLPAQPSVTTALAATRATLAEELAPMEADVWRTVVVPVRAGATWIFGCVVHHLAFDGWSEAVLARDLSRAAGHRGTAAPPPVSLAESAARHAAMLARADVPAQVTAACRELAGVPELVWPGETREPPGPPGRLVTGLSPATVAAVDRVAAGASVSRFVVLLAAWAEVVAEVTGQSDLAVGVPVAQRSDVRLAESVGCHIGMVGVRLRADAVKGGGQGVRATGAAVTRAFAAGEAPLAAVVERLGVPRTGRPPVFQALFAVQDNPPPRLDLPGTRTEFLRQPYLDLPLELHTELWPDPDGGMRIEVAFRPDAVGRDVAAAISARLTDRLTDLDPEVRQ